MRPFPVPISGLWSDLLYSDCSIDIHPHYCSYSIIYGPIRAILQGYKLFPGNQFHYRSTLRWGTFYLMHDQNVLQNGFLKTLIQTLRHNRFNKMIGKNLLLQINKH